ncbi:MAG: UDP-4-amino-4,6-dideoxy-N-acetyl-beta-L-altrosamine transaminase [Bacteriovoracia bacterium]
MNPIPYGRQTITDEDVAAVVEALKGEWLTQGPKIEEFEKKFAAYVGAPYAVAVSNGTAALHLAAMAMKVKPGQKVITTPITFAASGNCVRYCGGDVAFADIDPVTFLLDVQAVRRLLESHPKGTFHGIVPVDYAGLAVDMTEFRELANEFGLWIIEDACHAPGASFSGKIDGKKHLCGDSSLADAAIFSFHPVKHIACGEGGMITVKSKAVYDDLILLRTHGITKNPALFEQESPGPWYYEMQKLGYNYRLTDFQAALGVTQLARADQGLARRRAIAKRYEQAFRNTKVISPNVPSKREHAWHLYVVQVNNRAETFAHLRERGIYAQVHYVPMHTLPYYRRLGWKPGDFPLAESFYSRCISIPMYPALTDKEQDYVIQALLEIAQ